MSIYYFTTVITTTILHFDLVTESFLCIMLVCVCVIALLRKILVENPRGRMTLKYIEDHQWFKKNFLETTNDRGESCSVLKSSHFGVWMIVCCLTCYTVTINLTSGHWLIECSACCCVSWSQTDVILKGGTCQRMCLKPSQSRIIMLNRLLSWSYLWNMRQWLVNEAHNKLLSCIGVSWSIYLYQFILIAFIHV